MSEQNEKRGELINPPPCGRPLILGHEYKFKDGCVAYISPDLSWPDGCDLKQAPINQILETQMKRLDDWIVKTLKDFSADELKWVKVKAEPQHIDDKDGKYIVRQRYRISKREKPIDDDKSKELYKAIHEGKSNLMDI